MGNTRSGKRGGARCTDGMRSLDVRRIQQERMLKRGLAFGWDWTQNGETTAKRRRVSTFQWVQTT